MTFLNPILALTALGCVLAPIAIHLLFRRRTKPLEWGAMRFVLEAFKRQRKRMRLEQILILAARTLAVLLLALAVGRPMFAGDSVLQSRVPRDVVLVVDNSLTAQAVGAGEKTELETNKDAALRVLDGLDAGRGDRAALVTMGAPAEKVASPLTSELAGVRRAIEGIEATDSAADMTGAVAAARDLLGRDAARQSAVALLSGLRRGSIDAGKAVEPMAESTVRPELIVSAPANAALDNAAIVSVEPLRSVLLREASGQETQQARVTIARHGPGVVAAATVNLRLAAVSVGESDSPLWANTVVRFAAGQEAASVLAPIGFAKVEPGKKASLGALWIEARLDEDAIASDNVFRRVWKSRETVKVLLAAPAGETLGASPTAYSAADWITLALSPRTGGKSGALEAENEPISVSRVDPSRLSPADLIGVDSVFVTRPDLLAADGWMSLSEFARKGGLAVVTAPTSTAAAAVQMWPEPMQKAFGLNWTVAREVSVSGNAAPRSVRASATDSSPLAALLAGLSAELDELVKPVVVVRWLGAELGSVGLGEATRLLTLEDGSPWLVAARPEGSSRGLLAVLLTAPELESTSLPAMPLMVPLFQELVRQGVGVASGSANLLAGASVPEPADLRRVAIGAGSGSTAMPEVARSVSLWRRVDARGATRELVAINADAAGSATDVQTPEQLTPVLKASAQASDVTYLKSTPTGEKPGPESLPRTNRTPPMDLPLLIAGLALLVVDALLSRWFSHASVGSMFGSGAGATARAPSSGLQDKSTASSPGAINRGAAA